MKFFLVLCALTLAGCTSADELEDLQRRYQLLQLDRDNVAHERDALQRDLTQAKSGMASLEQQASDLAQSGADSRAAGRDVQQQLDDARQRVGFLEAQLQALREFLASDAAADKRARERHLEELAPAVAPVTH